MVSIKLLYVDHIYILPQKDSNEFLEKLRKDFLLGEDKSKWIEDITKNVEIEAYKDKEIIPVDKKLNIILLNELLLKAEKRGESDFLLSAIKNKSGFSTLDLYDYLIENFQCPLTHESDLKQWLSFVKNIPLGNEEEELPKDTQETIKKKIETKGIDVSFIQKLNHDIQTNRSKK
ncbi:TPA: hypothetical protein ACGOX3_001803 [Streptococcus suis]|nr:hypothetical protein [Streptococcus suis]